MHLCSTVLKVNWKSTFLFASLFAVLDLRFTRRGTRKLWTIWESPSVVLDIVSLAFPVPSNFKDFRMGHSCLG